MDWFKSLHIVTKEIHQRMGLLARILDLVAETGGMDLTEPQIQHIMLVSMGDSDWENCCETFRTIFSKEVVDDALRRLDAR